MFIYYYSFHSIVGQTCIDDVDNVQQIGDNFISPNRTVIVPRLNFSCNGRITNIRVRLFDHANDGANFPYVQVWRRQPLTSQSYNLVDEVQIQMDHFNIELNFLIANISLAGDNRIQFLFGDVIGFYSPPDTRYIIQDKSTMGYIFYVFVGSNASSLDLSSATVTPTNRQSLIQFTLGEYVNRYNLMGITCFNMILYYSTCIYNL